MGQFKRLTISTMDPHSTSSKPRDCKSCHISPKSLGLGYGNLYFANGKWQFAPATSKDEKIFGSERLDAFVSIKGTPLVHVSRNTLRPFNKKELEKILYVGLCLSCHDENDAIFKKWADEQQPLSPCKKFNLYP